MKKVWILIILFSVSSQLSGQDKNQLNEIIISSINSYIMNSKSLVKQGYSLMDTCCYYICMDGLPEDFSYNNVPNVVFFSLENLEGLPNSFKNKLKKGIKVLFICIILSYNQLTIIVAGRGVKRINKNNINIVIGDCGVYAYEYSCNEQEWKLKETKYRGV